MPKSPVTKQQLQPDFRALAESVLRTEEAQRLRMSRELHDEAGQSLVCIRLQLELLENSLPPESEELRSKLAEIRELTEKTIFSVRRMIGDLSPAVLEKLGLEAGLRQLTTQFSRSAGRPGKLEIGDLEGVPQPMNITIYRLAQECLSHLPQRTPEDLVKISVTAADSLLRLRVIDTETSSKEEPRGGPQEQPADASQGGTEAFTSVRERVILLGGQFECRAGDGISIDIRLPLIAQN